MELGGRGACLRALALLAEPEDPGWLASLPQLPGLPFLVPSTSLRLALERQLPWHPRDLIIAFLEDFSLRSVGSVIRDKSDGDDDVCVHV